MTSQWEAQQDKHVKKYFLRFSPLTFKMCIQHTFSLSCLLKEKSNYRSKRDIQYSTKPSLPSFSSPNANVSAHRTDYTWCFWFFSFDNMLSCFLAQNYIFSHKERAGWFFTQLLALHSWLGGWCSGGTKYLHSSQPWGGDLTYPVTRSGCHQSVDILSRDLSSCPGCPGFTSPSCSVSAAALLPLCSQWRLGRD